MSTAFFDDLDDASRNEIINSCKGLKILSTLPYKKIKFWNDCVETCKTESSSFNRIFELLKSAGKYDVVMLTGGEKIDLLYAAIAFFAFWVKTPHIVVDAHWQKKSGFAYAIQKIIIKLSNRLVNQYQPHSVEEIAIYNALFHIPINKLTSIPWSTSLVGHDIEFLSTLEKSDRALTGGSSFRDYEALFSAACNLNIDIDVGIKKGKLTDDLQKRWSACSNLHFLTRLSNAEYLKLMAGCKVFLMPIKSNLNRSTADQTILNAMFFGRVVIATDSIGSRIYIRHGVNGFLVSANSADEWKSTIDHVLSLPSQQIQKISENASHDARVLFNEPLRLYRTLKTAVDVAHQSKFLD
jgi:glycosyltransferase involved in cell wall biosynthesis